MIWIRIWGIPAAPESSLKTRAKEIRRLARGIPGREKDCVCVYFQKDMMRHDLGAEILIELEGTRDDEVFPNASVFIELAHYVKESAGGVCKYAETKVTTDGGKVTRFGTDKPKPETRRADPHRAARQMERRFSPGTRI